VTGPYTHKNVSVFLIHSDEQDGRDFMTLDEGLKEGVVRVTEKRQEEVGELLIDNRGDRPVFLQEGDRLSGGKQDRTIITSLVVPPKSGKMPLPAFCIEEGRWQAGMRGGSFSGTANSALATKSVRLAAKVAKDQVAVWRSVQMEKRVVAGSLASVPNHTTSLNEALDSPAAKKVSDDLAEALGGILKGHRDAVGVAIVVNGEIEEADIYPNHRLLGKLYPRLLESYALTALGRQPERDGAQLVSADDIARFMRSGGKKGAERTEQINASNSVEISDSAAKVRCSTAYDGSVVHQQVLSKKDAGGR
jgi:hypothetical protein